MAANFLKLNDDKTNLIVMGKPCTIDKLSKLKLKIGSADISQVASARNLAVQFQSDLYLDDHVSSTEGASYYQLNHLSKIRSYLDKDATEKLILAYTTSRLDYCNFLLTGIPVKLLNQLQLVQNSAVRLVCCERRNCHITPLLSNLHWLPVKQRVNF